VLLDEASQLAAAAGNFGLVFAALDQQAESYAVDPIVAKADALVSAAQSADTPQVNQALASAALELSDVAVLIDQLDQASRLVRVALGAARKGGDGELLKTCSARERELRELRRQ
jgi:hypothetical protein